MPLKSWRVYQPTLAVRCVCRECNNGWMSQLEVQAQRFLQPMLLGVHCGLDVAGQSTIALWSVKTAMVLDALDQPDQRAYAQLERKKLRMLSAIPWRTTVWLATSVDLSYFMSLKNRHLDAESSSKIAGVSITMALAHVVFQVLTIRVPTDVGPATQVTANVRRGPWDLATVQIWPTLSAKAIWPPPMGFFGETGLDSLAARFSTAALARNDTDAITV